MPSTDATATASLTQPDRRTLKWLLGTTLLASAAWLALPSSAHAADWQISAGGGDRASINKIGFGVVWDPHSALWQGSVWQLRLLHEAQVAFWDVPRASNIYEVGYSPFFRLQRGTASGGNWVPFIEASIGVRLISHTRLSDETRCRPPSSSRTPSGLASSSATGRVRPWACVSSICRMPASSAPTPASTSRRCITSRVSDTGYDDRARGDMPRATATAHANANLNAACT